MDKSSLEKQLRETREQLAQRLLDIKDDVGAGRSRDLEDQAQERENDEVLDALARDAALELEAVERALHRLENDQYGYCLNCEEPIEEKRLEAYPAAEYCIGCAELSEFRPAHSSTPGTAQGPSTT